MNRKLDLQFIKKQQEKLLEMRKKIKDDLSKFTEVNPEIKNDFESRFPKMHDDSNLEDEAMEVDVYNSRFSTEKVLEQGIREINQALKKIKNGTYGICEKCGRPISLNRLKIRPQAIYCIKCKKRIS